MADSIREALTAAYDKAETETPDTETGAPAADVETETMGAADDVAATSDDASSAAPDAEAVPSNETSEAAQAAPTPEPDSPSPASWTAAERAEWSKVPKSARDAIARRETEMGRALQVSADARRRVSAIDQIGKQYEPLLRSYGITVEQAMPGLLATRAALEVGTPEQKAELVANICADFGLDLNLLDQALGQRFQNGQPPPRYQPQARPDFRRDPSLAPLYDIAEQLAARRAAEAQRQVDEVKTKPHYEAVKLTMADLIDNAKAHGRELPLVRAYDIATQLHGLEAAPAAVAPQQSRDEKGRFEAARKAASSVSGAPKPTPPRQPGTGTARDEIEALMSNIKL